MSALQDAVNSMLIARGLAPVVDINSGHPLVVAARNILERNSKTVQDNRWWYNTEPEVQLSRNMAGQVPLPSNVLNIDETDLVILGGMLYDLEERTNVFTEDPDPLTLIVERDWDDLPLTVYNYIIALSIEEFIRPLESQLKTQQSEKAINRTFALMQKADMNHKDVGTSLNPLMQRWRSKMVIR